MLHNIPTSIYVMLAVMLALLVALGWQMLLAKWHDAWLREIIKTNIARHNDTKAELSAAKTSLRESHDFNAELIRQLLAEQHELKGERDITALLNERIKVADAKLREANSWMRGEIDWEKVKNAG